MRHPARGPALVALLLLTLTLTQGARAGERLQKIFVVHSYEKGHVCGQPQHDGLLTSLKEAGFVPDRNLDLRVFYMDTKRKNNTPQLIRRQASLALRQIDEYRPRILVTLDDNAFKHVALKLVDRSVSIIFSGLNGRPEDYDRQTPFMETRSRPSHNITGVYEKLHVADALRVHARMFPGTKKVLFLTDPSPTGLAIKRQVFEELNNEEVPVDWELRNASSWEKYQDLIRGANQDRRIGAIYPVALLLRDRNGRTYTAPEIFSWTTRVSRKPEIAVNYAFTRLGLFGGAAVDFHAMGRQAGDMVVNILRGRPPGDIPIEEARRFALTFNLKRARQLGITIPTEILLAADEVIR
ncbi:MAG: hypothetical protein JRF59_02770 [Deltaproteobacteria bacterium]|nr:hypothetical protein [Deltaproteobacteria bacterium]MBW1949057.1 hypothetical protein [Deltaproteobacteria bacterium]MBW2007397.1 hypothetical protein [Deltaproteobacteria bacterium]MBW2101781.1 hypothetical protein [Deltaproteobacteria bacterium]MBW2346752.1 hypothetical protein [Deltaproteobacteria bacterium]